MGIRRTFSHILRKRWTPEQAKAMVGEWQKTWLGHATDSGIRECAASGGVVSAILVDMLEHREIDGALVCSTVVEEHRVRPRFRIVTIVEDVLEARGSTYVATRFAKDALPLIEEFDGRLAVVGLPCDLALLDRVCAADERLAAKVVLKIGLMCGHASQPELVDAVTARLEREAGGRLEEFRFRIGHWRGRLRATFDNDVHLDKPFSIFGLRQNLYHFADKRCLFCGDHFAYASDITCGDVWIPELKDDPVKHDSVIVRTEAGREALDRAESRSAVELTPVGIADILEGQARTAPFHYNVSARSKAAARYGMKIPDRVGAPVKWHEHMAARMVVAGWRRSQTERGAKAMLLTPSFLYKIRLYMLKGLETLPGSVAAEEDAPVSGSKIAVIAGTISGNRGAEAMLTTCIGKMRERFPEARFFAYSYYPEQDRRLNHDLAVTVHSATPASLVLVHLPFALLGGLWRLLHLRALMRLAPSSVRDLGACDVLLDVAGVSFIDGREKFLPFNVLTLWPAMLLGVPVIKMSQAMGTFENTLNRFAAKRMLPRCARVFARGEHTRANLETLDLPEPPLAEAADIAFLHEERYALSEENPRYVEELLERVAAAKEDGRAMVGICPSSVLAAKARKRGSDYIGTLVRLVEHALEAGHGVLLFPNATREASGERLRNNDLPVIAAVMERSGEEVRESGTVVWVEHDLNAAAIKRLLAACDVALVSRFHAMVGALANKVPVGVVGWSHKYLEVMEQFELGEMVLDHSEDDENALLGLMDRLVEEKKRLTRTIAKRLPDVRKSSKAQFAYVASLLEDLSETDEDSEE